MPYGDDGAIHCNEEIVGTPCHYKDEYREHINRVMGNGKSNIPAAASLPSPPALTGHAMYTAKACKMNPNNKNSSVAELVHEDAPHWGCGGVTFEKCMV
jgi:hypothetical protein